MSIRTEKGINCRVIEGGKQNGAREIKGYALEVPNTQPQELITGRTDYFEGVGYQLTIAEAEALHKQLGESLAFIKPLIASGKVKERK